MKRLFFVVLFLLQFSIFNLFAAPVYRLPVVRIQPNGDTLHLFVTGDEYYHRLHDADNYTVVQHPQTGYWVFADRQFVTQDKWDVVPTDYVVGRINPLVTPLSPNVGVDRETWLKCQHRYDLPESLLSNCAKSSDRNRGELNNIVIFIRFADDLEITTPFSTINAMFNDSSASSVSLYSYFKGVSYNQIAISTSFYPYPSGDMVVSYQDSLPRCCFEPYNAATNPQGYTNQGIVEKDLLERAINYVNANCPPPTDLNVDMDNDGMVDNVCFIIKGASGDWDDLLWPHMWSIQERDLYINGKRVNRYNFQLEGSGDHYFSTSTFCHEMFHSLGAPDLYRYEYYTNVDPVGTWDIMGYNTTPPQSMGAYMKWKYGNWIDSIPEITQSGTYSLHSLSSGNSANCCYKVASYIPHQWYLFEYRNNTDRFEENLSGSGLLIYRIDDRFNGSMEFDGEDDYDEVYIFRPGGINQVTNGSLSQAFFSQTAHRTDFDYTTNPFPWLSGDVADSSLFVSDISAPSDTISFTVRLGTVCVKPQQLRTSDISNNGAILSWEGTAESYRIQWREDGFDAAEEVDVDESSYSLTGLDVNTGYQWRVKSLCGDDNTSIFTDWTSFITMSCDDVVVAEVSVGDTFATFIPMSPLYPSNYSQMIYTAEELAGRQSIDRVSFHYTGSDPIECKKNVTFYLGHTNQSSFSGATLTDFFPVCALTQVYKGDFKCYDGWNTFVFDTPFNYDGSSNLVFALLDNSGNAAVISRFWATKTDERSSLACLSRDRLNPQNLSSTFVQGYNFHCDIRFGGCREWVDVDVVDDNVSVTIHHRTITVVDPNHRSVSLYDIVGRKLFSSTGLDVNTFTVPSSGIYLLSIPGLPAKKLVLF